MCLHRESFFLFKNILRVSAVPRAAAGAAPEINKILPGSQSRLGRSIPAASPPDMRKGYDAVSKLMLLKEITLHRRSTEPLAVANGC